MECPDGSSAGAAFAVGFEAEGAAERRGGTSPLTELGLAGCNPRGKCFSRNNHWPWARGVSYCLPKVSVQPLLLSRLMDGQELFLTVSEPPVEAAGGNSGFTVFFHMLVVLIFWAPLLSVRARAAGLSSGSGRAFHTRPSAELCCFSFSQGRIPVTPNLMLPFFS